MMRGPREDRVVAIEDFINRTERLSVEDPEMTPFMLRYLASRIAPGTIRNSSVLGALSQRHPSALLWYGFCAGFGETDANVSRSEGGKGYPYE